MRGLVTLVCLAVLAGGCSGNSEPGQTRAADQLVFVAGEGYVFTIGADGAGLRQVTRDPDWGAASAVWSPDGSRLAVVTSKVPEGHNAALVVMDASGLHRRRLAYLPSEQARLRWSSPKTIEVLNYRLHRLETSAVDAQRGGRPRPVRVEYAGRSVRSPDRRLLAFERTTPHGDTQIYVGSDRRHAVNVSRSQSVGPSRLTETRETWSPDGSRLAFALDRGLSDDTRELRVMRADGSEERRIALVPHFGGVTKWSSDGRFLAYVGDADDDSLDELYVVPAGGGYPRRLDEREYIQDFSWRTGSSTPGKAESPRASVRTRLVRTYSGELTTGQARLVDVRLLRRFVSNEDRPSLADLSPDGSLLAVRWHEELGLLDLRRNTIRAVSPARPAGGYDVQALFSPDGRRLLYRHWAALRVLDLASGQTRDVAQTSSWGDFAWLADGRIAFSDNGRLKLVQPGGRPRLVAEVPRVSRWAISPRGRRVLYDSHCETFLLDRATGRSRRLSGHMFVLPRSWAPDGTHFVLQWAEECTRKTDAIWAYHTYDVLYSRGGDEVAGLQGHGATWSRDSKLVFTYSQPTGSAVSGLEALIAVDPRGKRASTLLPEGNAYSEAFIGPGRWVVFTRYDRPERVSYNETSGGLYVGRLAGR